MRKTDYIRQLYVAVEDAKAEYDTAFMETPFMPERLAAARVRLRAANHESIDTTSAIEMVMQQWLDMPTPYTWDAVVAAWREMLGAVGGHDRAEAHHT